MTGRYAEMHARSLRDPNGFWGEAAEAVHWFKKPDYILDDRDPQHPRWFTGGETNACYNALDRHVENGRGDQAAIIYDSPVTDTIRSYAFRELRDQTAKFAGALRKLGVGYGDRVIIYMPMVPEAVVAMYACARIGAVHSVVFGGFAANELAVRIDDCQAKVVVTASSSISRCLTGRAISPSTSRPMPSCCSARSASAAWSRAVISTGPTPWRWRNRWTAYR